MNKPRTVQDMSIQELRDMLCKVIDIRNYLSNWGDHMTFEEVLSQLDSALKS